VIQAGHGADAGRPIIAAASVTAKAARDAHVADCLLLHTTAHDDRD
jgi:ribonuclease HII